MPVSREAVRPYPPAVRWLLLPVARVVAWALVGVLGGLRVRGKYRVPKRGGVLILANHLADLDPIVVQMACPRPVHFMAKSELFEMPVLGRLIRVFQAFPVRRGEPDRNAMRRAVDLLKLGEVVCVFPEGQLSESGELQPLKPGVALIARMADVPVICLGLVGTNRMMPYGTVVPRPAWRACDATWGEVYDPARSTDLIAWAESELRVIVS